MKTIYKIILITLIGISQIHKSDAKAITKNAKSSIYDVKVKIDSNCIKSNKENVISIKTKLLILNGSKNITNFNFLEAFNWHNNRFAQVSGIGELSSSGFSVLRHWESLKNPDDDVIILTGWIIIFKSGQVTKNDLIGFKFNVVQEGTYTCLIKGIPALITKTNTIKIK